MIAIKIEVTLVRLLLKHNYVMTEMVGARCALVNSADIWAQKSNLN